MIKARGDGPDGRPVMVLGLSWGNLDRLRAGLPIKFDGAPLGFAGTVIIMSGQTEAAIARTIMADSPNVDLKLEGYPR